MTKIKAKNNANAMSFLNSTILTLVLTDFHMILAANRLFAFLLQYSSWMDGGPREDLLISSMTAVLIGITVFVQMMF